MDNASYAQELGYNYKPRVKIINDLKPQTINVNNSNDMNKHFIMKSIEFRTLETPSVYLNISVINLTFTGVTSDDCGSWGIMIFDTKRWAKMRLYHNKLQFPFIRLYTPGEIYAIDVFDASVV